RRKSVSSRDYGWLRRGELLSKHRCDSRSDGCLSPESRAWLDVRAAELHRNLRRRRLPEPIWRLDRTALGRRNHGRLRRRKLLPGKAGHPTANGGIPPEDGARV